MPIFDYQCEEPLCGRVTERIVSADRPTLACPYCIGIAIKQLSAPASIRMGTGTRRHDSGMNRTEV